MKLFGVIMSKRTVLLLHALECLCIKETNTVRVHFPLSAGQRPEKFGYGHSKINASFNLRKDVALIPCLSSVLGGMWYLPAGDSRHA